MRIVPKKMANFRRFWVKESPVIQKPFHTKTATYIVARVRSMAYFRLVHRFDRAARRRVFRSAPATATALQSSQSAQVVLLLCVRRALKPKTT